MAKRRPEGARARSRHLDAFLEMLAAERGASLNTIEAYGRDLDDYERFLGRGGGASESVEVDALRREREELQRDLQRFERERTVRCLSQEDQRLGDRATVAGLRATSRPMVGALGDSRRIACFRCTPVTATNSSRMAPFAAFPLAR